jgi:hypothetical protein
MVIKKPAIMPPRFSTCELRVRVVAFARSAVRAHLMSERRLAQLAFCSQPHMHNVLAGVRECAPELADAIGRALGVSLLDLYTVDEVRALVEESQAQRRARLEVDEELAA